ncbi:unnamed protein product [Brachionus calyciflorus]|uniref:Uncharacterized protein n=1 Tax=Brachionus calyciflorus TaxID=104777 RepID=A0A813MXK7_9BILA|nr:unnamed protein product [Brachionus calyciflorus]
MKSSDSLIIKNLEWENYKREATIKCNRDYRSRQKKMKISIETTEHINETNQPFCQMSLESKNSNEELLEYNLDDQNFVTGVFDEEIDYEHPLENTSDYSNEFTDKIINDEIDAEIEMFEPISKNINVNVREFSLGFISCCQRIRASRTTRETILDFIKTLFPWPNKIPKNYSSLAKIIDSDRVSEKKLCNFCKNEFKNNQCPNIDCRGNYNICNFNSNHSLLYTFNVKAQLTDILQREWIHFKTYKDTIKYQSNSDICNSLSYTEKEDVVSIALFVDGASITKSSNDSMWAIFSTVNELPPIIRNSKKNILVHTLWSGDIDLNLILEKYTSIDFLIKNGVDIEINNIKIKLKFKVKALVCDTIARPKICYSTQFNGEFGCLHCLHPNNDSNKQFTRRVYNYREDISLRSHESYLKDVEEAIRTKKRSNGIKGFSYLSNWLKIPNDIVLDYMHLSLEGTTKWFINQWFNNASTNYYLGMKSSK